MNVRGILQRLRLLINSFPIQKGERFLFFILVFVNASVVFAATYLKTLDGPSHLYNAGLIAEIISGNDSAVNQLYQINTQSLSNWPSHLLLLFFRLFTSPWMAEKILIGLCCFLLPYAVRALLKTLQISPAKALLALPFTYSNFTSLGFYNYIIAVVVLFVFIRSVYLLFEKPKLKQAIYCFLWLGLLYFSHPYVFVTGILVAGFSTLIHCITLVFKRQVQMSVITAAIMLFIVSGYVLMLYFFLQRHTGTLTAQNTISQEELTRHLLIGHTFTMYGLLEEEPNTNWFIRIWSVLLIAAVLIRILQYRNTGKHVLTDAWLLSAVVITVAYFILPDDLGGGMNTFRLRYLVTLCFVVWVLFQPVPRLVWIAAIPVLLFFHTAQQQIHYAVFRDKDFEKNVEELIAVGRQLPKNTITLPITFTYDMWQSHAVSYVGTEHSRAVVENGEATMGWFPVHWIPEAKVRLAGQEQTIQRIDDRTGYYFSDSTHLIRADYVLVWNRPLTVADSSWFAPVDSLIKTTYHPIYSSEHVQLYQKGKIIQTKK
jgi:hypothetical protein